MIGGFPIGGAAVAAQPVFGGSHAGLVYGSDSTMFHAYGGDTVDDGVVFGGVSATQDRVYGGDTSSGSGIVVGGDTGQGTVYGGDERA